MKDHTLKFDSITRRLTLFPQFASALSCAILCFAGATAGEAATYTWEAGATSLWSTAASWNPDSPAGGPVAGDTIGATTAVGALRMDANVRTSYAVQDFTRSGTGSWTIEAYDTSGSSLNRNVTLAISGNLRSDGGTAGAITQFRSNTVNPANATTLGMTVGGTLYANTGDIGLGGLTAPSSTYDSSLSSLSVTGTTTINAGQKIYLFVKPGQASLGRVTNNGMLQIYRAGDGTTADGSVSIGTLGSTTGTGQVIVSDYLGTTGHTATLNISGPISGSFSGTLANGASNDVLNIAKSNTGVQTLTGNNTFTGTTTVSGGTLELAATGGNQALGGTTSVAVNTVGTLLILSQSDQINNSATVSLGGGQIKLNGAFSETMGALTLTAASTLDYGIGFGASNLTFGTYTGNLFKLTVSNFDIGDVLVLGGDVTGTLSDTNLFGFSSAFNSSYNSGTGLTTISAVPEPSSVLLVGTAGLLGLALWRKRKSSSR